jgi:hypothetical protein
MRWRIIGATLLALGASACGSKGAGDTASGTTMHTCATDTASWLKASYKEAGTSLGNISCPGPISTYCADYATSCPPTDWGAVVSGFQSACSPSELYNCGQYNLVGAGWACGGDTHVVFLYDSLAGGLVAAVEISTSKGETCLGGPKTLDVWEPCSDWFTCDIADGGVAVQHGGDAGLP